MILPTSAESGSGRLAVASRMTSGWNSKTAPAGGAGHLDDDSRRRVGLRQAYLRALFLMMRPLAPAQIEHGGARSVMQGQGRPNVAFHVHPVSRAVAWPRAEDQRLRPLPVGGVGDRSAFVAACGNVGAAPDAAAVEAHRVAWIQIGGVIAILPSARHSEFATDPPTTCQQVDCRKGRRAADGTSRCHGFSLSWLGVDANHWEVRSDLPSDWYRDWFVADDPKRHKDRVYQTKKGQWRLSTCSG